MVQQAIHQQRVYFEIAPPTSPEPPTTRGPNRLLVYLRGLRALNSDDYQRARRDTIVNVALNSEDKEATFQSLSLYLRDISLARLPTTHLQGDNHQRHLLLGERSGDESTPRCRGTGSKQSPLHNHHPGRHRRRSATIPRHYGSLLDQRLHSDGNKYQAALCPTASHRRCLAANHTRDYQDSLAVPGRVTWP